ncbi:cobaltochelatase subunit CobN [Acinetobacter stercoris]|uniref:Aerobic cobaltochelatase subunit CobN n=1 Tax=Acinetobacter stercoris TaxID=2126983 RepID=A0A2U3MX38_9GAMM|nr:cobaltochelatase subunit CobN [Acinetobacter stercoris]SPL69990.1 Aerobic cobaltochelatase subunit CobN [Acinetobacter stercoris]
MFRSFFVKCSLACLLMFTFVHAYATQVLIVHNSFVEDTKYEKLAQIAQQENVKLVHWNVSQKDEGLTPVLEQSDLVILDVPRPPDRQEVEEKVLRQVDQLQKKYIIIGGGAPKISGVPKLFGYKLLMLYANGGALNFKNFFSAVDLWATKGKTSFPSVQKLPEISIYHPKAPQYFAKPADYLQWYKNTYRPDQKTAAQAVFIIHPSTITDLTAEKIDQLIDLAEQKNVVPLVVLLDERKAKTTLSEYLSNIQVDALVNMTHIQQGQKLVEELSKINTPMIQALAFQGNAAQWQEATSGVPPYLTAIFLSMPEIWGFSDPLVLSTKEQGKETWLKPQVDLLLDKVVSQSHLKHLNNADKKVAVMFWNYPYGAKNLSASNLNIPVSIVNIQKAMAAQGYKVPEMSEKDVILQLQALLSVFYDHAHLKSLQEQNLVAYFPVKDYLDWVKTLPEHRQKELPNESQIKQHWAVVEKDQQYFFTIPRLQVENLQILPQPPRSSKLGENYHSQAAIPDALYLATYLYLQKNNNALIHLGTHGTQEWLPGKDRGLDHADYSYLTAGALPIFYPYVQDNIAEAIQAKRRGRAVTISHQTAPLSPSGLYDELRDMHEVIHQYIQLDEGSVKQQTQAKLIGMVEKSGIARDLGWTKARIEQDFPTFFNQLHDHLHHLAQQNVPLGLHRFGQTATDEQRIIIVMQQLGPKYIEALKQDPDEVFNIDASEIKNTLAYRWLAHNLLDQPDDEAEKVKARGDLKKFLEQAQTNFNNLSSEQELKSLLNGLQGGYILPGTGGDPIRQPQSVSGRNLYAFEANKVPSQSAYQTGMKTFDQLIAQYQQKHPNQYPKKVAFSLWSSETIRHLGVTEAQVLHALGLKPVWDEAGRVVKLEIIPRAELKRPRIDVVIQATSVYRDQFDSFIRLLSQAIAQLSELDESDNQLYQHAKQLQAQLVAQNIPEDQAKALSQLKVFSNKPGEYGSNLTQHTLKYDQWDNDKELADTFLNNLQYAYGDKTWGEAAPQNLFAENLKGVDVAVMSRSSNVQGVLSTDHPFEYLGGLSLVIRTVQGKSPELLITDLRQNKSEVTTLKAFLSDELRSRYLNPQWIKGMQNEGYAGTLEVLNATNNLYGWNVTDPSVVRDDQWQDMYDTYVLDKRNLGVKKWFEKENPSAQLQVLTRMAEAIRQDYWKADEQTRQQLAQTIRDIQKQQNLNLESKRVQQFVNQQMKNPTATAQADTQKNVDHEQPPTTENVSVSADTHAQTRPKIAPKQSVAKPSTVASMPAQSKPETHQSAAKGQGLNPKTATAADASVAKPAAANSVTQKVQGQTLQQVEKKSQVKNYVWVVLLGVLALLGVGAAKQLIRRRKS